MRKGGEMRKHGRGKQQEETTNRGRKWGTQGRGRKKLAEEMWRWRVQADKGDYEGNENKYRCETLVVAVG